MFRVRSVSGGPERCSIRGNRPVHPSPVRPLDDRVAGVRTGAFPLVITHVRRTAVSSTVATPYGRVLSALLRGTSRTRTGPAPLRGRRFGVCSTRFDASDSSSSCRRSTGGSCLSCRSCTPCRRRPDRTSQRSRLSVVTAASPVELASIAASSSRRSIHRPVATSPPSLAAGSAPPPPGLAAFFAMASWQSTPRRQRPRCHIVGAGWNPPAAKAASSCRDDRCCTGLAQRRLHRTGRCFGGRRRRQESQVRRRVIRIRRAARSRWHERLPATAARGFQQPFRPSDKARLASRLGPDRATIWP